MPIYTIRGIDVDFPYEAYECQLVYMEKVIQSLQQGSNALLESPTGTGKTLCLLCATLAWRKSLGAFSKRRPPKKGNDKSGESSSQSEPGLPMIIYTSRTHSQLRQVIQELKRSNYRPKMVVLGSREQLCIHEEVSLLQGRAQTNACHSLCKKRKKRFCKHFPRVNDFMKANPALGDEPIDIEDMVNIGKKCEPCPYYMSRELHKVADIVFAPYNYLIDRNNRKSLSIEWNKSVLIFDEAHNLESLCSDAASFDLPSGTLKACIFEAKDCIDLSIQRRDQASDKSCNPDNFAILRALLLKLEKRIGEIHIESKEMGFTKPGPYIYELLAELNITYKTATMLMGVIDEAALLLEEDASVDDGGGQNKVKGTVCRLESMGDILKIIFRDGGQDHAKYYRFHVQEIEARNASYRGTVSRTLSWWCFNPGLAMEEFCKLGVGSILLTSGTLSPMDSFAQEFRIEFPIRLENPHVISSNQIWTGVVPVGPSGYSFNSSYRSRDSKEYKLELGNAIVNFARIVPDGLLVFFPSYYLLDTCIEFWKDMTNSTSSTIWERICKHKMPVVEPRQSALFTASIEDYMTKLKDISSKGAVFFAVCRGKVSEGLDFADHAGRAVVITGMPFATFNDPKVRLKREFLDQTAQCNQIGCKALTGEEWYSQQASRAVNQAVGRVIRHRHDYGAIIFCDERFAQTSRQAQISLWIQPHIKCYSKFGDVVFTLTRFFRDGSNRGPTKLELSSKENNDNINASRSSQTADKSYLANLLSPLTTPTESADCFKLSSPLTKLKDISSLWEGIVPANRSLNLDNHEQSLNLIRSGDLLYNKPKLLIPGKRSIPYKTHIIDLTSAASSDEVILSSSITPCTLKKPKIEPGLTQDVENSQSTMEFCRARNNVHVSSSTACSDQEKKGSAFLIQVKEKLNDAEYKEFVGFMRDLKSKAMKIGQVLQSIIGLFSSPDRLPLRERFKEYIPAKYRPLYEDYLSRSSDFSRRS